LILAELFKAYTVKKIAKKAKRQQTGHFSVILALTCQTA